MRVIAIVQARMGSTRLPGKVLKKIEDKTVLHHVIDRLKQSKQLDDIIIATTEHSNDDSISKEADIIGVNCFRGSEEDVLSRYYYAAKEYKADVVVRITSDCPLLDPQIIDEIIEFYLQNQYVMVSNAGNELNRTYPRGLDTEVFSYKVLKDAYVNAKQSYQREHVTPYLYENYKVFYFRNNIDYSKYRLTLDTAADFELIHTIYQGLYQGTHNFYLKDIINFMEKNQELYNINRHIKQKNFR